MNDSIRISPDELSRLVVEAAMTADEQGYWSGPGAIVENAVQHMVHYLGLLLAGDDHVDPREMEIFGRVFRSASGAAPEHDDLLAAALDSVEMASDPDALHAFLNHTPAYLRAILAMDRERGTRNARQVVTALAGLGLAVLAADGRAALEEDSILSTHLNHLRGEMDAHGVAGES